MGHKPKLYGREQPRIFTPPLRPLKPAVYDDDGNVLEPATTLGFEVIEFATHVLGLLLYPWQQWLLIHALELREDGTFRFRTLVVLVARQNGKSRLSQVLALYCMYVLGIRLVIGTAQDLDTAEEVWQGAVDLVEEEDDDGNLIRPDLAELLKRVVQVNGKKSLELTSGERYKVKAATRRGGRGLSGDLILLDELREHQTWQAWSAVTKTTMARPRAQVWALSNAGDAASVVLRYLRLMAHKALGDPDGINAAADPSLLLDADEVDVELVEIDEDDDTLGIFEWSAPPGCDIHDRDGWAQANPSLNHTSVTPDTITERAIASAARTDPEWEFRTEVLCQWSDGTLEGPFPAGTWEAGVDKDSAIADGARIGVCVDVAWDRTRSHIGAAGAREDGDPHVEVIASRGGTDWVVGWFTDPANPHRMSYQVALQPSSPAGSLQEDLENAGVDVVEWKGVDLSQACGQLYDRVRDVYEDEDGKQRSRLRHRPQPLLDVAAATAVTRPLNDSWVWDRKKSPVDSSPLVAVTGALWLVSKPEEQPWAFYDD